MGYPGRLCACAAFDRFFDWLASTSCAGSGRADVVGFWRATARIRSEIVRDLVAFAQRVIAGTLHVIAVEEQIVAVLLTLRHDEAEAAIAYEFLDSSLRHSEAPFVWLTTSAAPSSSRCRCMKQPT